MSRTSTPEIDVDQLDTAVRTGAAIVDVRERSEYVAGHVPGAVLIGTSDWARSGRTVVTGDGPRS